MERKATGFGFRLTGLILGIVAAVTSTVAIVFAALGMRRARQCKHCKMDELYNG